MIVLAHILSVPVEEVLVPLATGGAGAGVLALARAWIVSRARRR
ncbi:MAG: hypothetical protein ACREM2_02535 [Vulcanimicrobiaceae bacterium]